jgi:hypothetical protein
MCLAFVSEQTRNFFPDKMNDFFVNDVEIEGGWFRQNATVLGSYLLV